MENQNKNKCAILVLRERHPEKKQGARRTRIFVIASENENDIFGIVSANVEPGTKIFTDEASGYTILGARWDHHVVISHSTEYSTDDGVNENQADTNPTLNERIAVLAV